MANGPSAALAVAAKTLQDLFSTIHDVAQGPKGHDAEALNPNLTLLIIFAKHPFLPLLFPVYIHCPEYEDLGRGHWTTLKIHLQIPIPLGTVGFAFARFRDKPHFPYDQHPDVFEVPTGTVSVHDLLFNQQEHVSLPLRDERSDGNPLVGLLAVGSRRPGALSHWNKKNLRRLANVVKRVKSDLLRGIDDFRLAEEKSLSAKILQLVEQHPAEGIERLLFEMQAMAESEERPSPAKQTPLSYHPYWNLGITGLEVDPATIALYPQRMPDLPPVSSHLILGPAPDPHPRLRIGPRSDGTYRFEGTDYRKYRCYADGIAMRHLRHGNETTNWWSHIASNSPPELAAMLAKIAEAKGDYPFEQYVISHCGVALEDAPERVRDDFTTFLAYSYAHQRLILNLVLMLHFDKAKTEIKHPWMGTTVKVRRTKTKEEFIIHVGKAKLILALKSYLYSGPRGLTGDIARCAELHPIAGRMSRHRVRIWYEEEGKTKSASWGGCTPSRLLFSVPLDGMLHSCPMQAWLPYMRILTGSWLTVKSQLAQLSLSDPKRYFPQVIFTAYPSLDDAVGRAEGAIDDTAIIDYMCRLLSLHCARYSSRHQMMQNAITSIITESFSHNVAAHALEGVCSRLQGNSKASSVFEDGEEETGGKLAAFMRYLIEKADFWISPQRGPAEGVTIIRWRDLLAEIPQNPLFWGTVNITEFIKRVTFHVSFEADSGAKHASGTLCSIDTETLSPAGSGTQDSDLDKALDSDDALVALPGKSSGKQAFLTIIENVLRNAKHCRIAADGTLNLHLNIRSRRSGQPWWDVELYLAHEALVSHTLLPAPDADRIIDAATGKPVFGGSSQGLLCAAYLFCFTYDLVDTRLLWLSEDSGDIQCCFPWVTSVQELHNGLSMFVTRFRLWRGAWIAPVAGKQLHGTRESSKSAEVSADDGLVTVSRDDRYLEVIDQVRRYGVFISETEAQADGLRRLGIVRIVTSKTKRPDLAGDALLLHFFKLWLSDWLELASGSRSELVVLKTDTEGTQVGYSDLTWARVIDPRQGPPQDENTQFLMAYHGAHSDVRGRTSLQQDKKWLVAHRTNGRGGANIRNADDRFMQLRFIEALQTSIVVVDDRLAFELSPLEMVNPRVDEWDTWRTLRLLVFDEREPWSDLVRRVRAIGENGRLHFLVVHLSYLETQPAPENSQGAGPQESMKGAVVQLVEQLMDESGGYPFRHLVITTGRGRMGWYDELRGTGVPLLFMPPASLTSAVSSGVQNGDDLDVKLGLASRLLGY